MLYPLGDLDAGKYVITVSKNAPIKGWHHISLEGEFDVCVESRGMGKSAIYTYNLNIHIPEEAHVTLSARRGTLSTEKSWALQGQPFYSGGITYNLKVQAEECGEYAVFFPGVRDVVDIYVNGRFCNRLIKPPYEEKIMLNKGENDLKLTVYSSNANKMEQYLEPSGLTGGAYIEKI